MAGIFDKDNNTNCIVCNEKSCAAATLNKGQLNLLNDNSQETYIKKGETILKSGALTSHIVYLKTGYVKEHVEGPGQKSKILQIIKQQSYLGLQSLFGSRINQYSYTALDDLRVCYIDLKVFKNFLKERGSFALEVLHYVSRESLHKDFHLINQGHKKMYGRFADVLIYLSDEIFEAGKFDILLSRQELAELAGMSRENTARALTHFRDEGIIKINGKAIEILKADLLKKISKNG
jgi:CRP-like cAMP-binding protein